jgi:hypothetical protein
MKIGDMVRINARWRKRGRTQAIQAWRHKNPAHNFFSHHEPQDSLEYEKWFKNLSESVGYVVKIDQEDWIKVQFFCFDHEIWLREQYLCLHTS